MKRKVDPTIVARVLDLVVQIQQVPAPTFEENERAEFIHSQFIQAGVPGSFIDEIGNVYARIPGRGEQPPLVITAHLDTVFPRHTDLAITRTPERISGPGIGDNSLGVATLFGLYWVLGGDDKIITKPNLPGDLWLVANVAEEGLGNLKGMKAVVDRFGGGALAYLVLEGMSLGQIYHRGLGVRRYQVQVHTRGGHSWVDYGSPSAIHELVELVVRFTHLPLPVEPRTSLNVGVVSGGTTVNTIAAEASLQLDIRSVSPLVLDEISKQVQGLVEEANRKRGEAVSVEARVIGDRPAGEIPADHPLVCLARNCYEARGIKVRLNIGSTDTNLPLSRGLPAICVGLTTGGGAHTRGEFIDTGPYSDGLAALVDLVRIIFKKGVSA